MVLKGLGVTAKEEYGSGSRQGRGPDGSGSKMERVFGGRGSIFRFDDLG